MIFKVISHLTLYTKTHLISGSSSIFSSENLAEKTAFFGRNILLEFPNTAEFNPSGTLSNSS